MNNGLLLATIIENISTRKDGTIKLVLGTQEMSQSKAGELFSLQNKLAAVYISPKDVIPQKELDQADAVDVDLPGKSKSQRQRSVIFLIWQHKPEGHKTFETYYHFRMEQNIERLKKELEVLT